MIPKLLHFVWIGQKPSYADFAISAFGAMNPSCSINFLECPIQKLEQMFFNEEMPSSRNDQIVLDLAKALISKSSCYETLVHQVVHNLAKCSEVRFIQVLSDVLRLELLNQYGGIYIDCDAYPMKPFEESLFAKKRFCVHDKMLSGALYRNNYFLGSDGSERWEDYFSQSCEKVEMVGNQRLVNMNHSKSFDFQVRRVKFFKCKLQSSDFIGCNSNDSFEHYSDFRWGNAKVEATRLDPLFDKASYLKDF